MVFGNVMRDILARSDRNPYRVARENAAQERGRRRSTIWSLLHRIITGEKRYTEYETVIRSMGGGGMAVDDGVLLVAANLEGTLDHAVEVFAVYLWYMLIPPEEREAELLGSLAGTGIAMADLIERLQTEKFADDPVLAAFVSLTRSPRKQPPARPGESPTEAREREEHLAGLLSDLRADLADALIESVTISRSGRSFRIAWTDRTRQVLAARGIGIVDRPAYRLDGDGLTFRDSSRHADRDDRAYYPEIEQSQR